MSGQRLRYDPYDPFSDANIAGGPAIGSGRDSLDRGGQDYNNTTREGWLSGDSVYPSNPFSNSSYTGVPRSELEADLSTSAAYRNAPFQMSERGYGDFNNVAPKPVYGSVRESSSVLDSGPSPWLRQQQKQEQRSKRLIWAAVLIFVGLIIVGIVIGVVVSQNKNRKAASSSSNPGVVKQDDPNDPSTFVKNPALHQAFYGIAYTPEGSQLPGCGNKLADVITDIQLLSQLTKRIRLYGADCNQSALVLEAIQRTKVDMQVWLGVYPIPTDNNAAYNRQKAIIKKTLETYGTDHVAGITVGNEFILNYLGANGGGSDPNSAVGDAGADLLLANIQDMRDMLSQMGLKIPVGNSDAGFYFNTKVLRGIDYGLANVHPWFANTTAEDAAAWTANFFQTVNVEPANALPNRPQMYIAETGWPTKSSDAGNANNGASTASVANLQIFLDTFVCQANQNGTGYFFFEFSDEPWKDAQFGGVEGWWGLFTSDRKLKPGITIPTCTAP